MSWIKDNLRNVIIGAVVFGIIAFYGGIKVADQPFFCGMLCHEMAPHVDTLKESLHAKKGVTCMDCHSHQGFFNHAYEHIVSLAFVPIHFSKIYLEDELNLHEGVAGFDKHEMDFLHKPKNEHAAIQKKCTKCHPNRVPGSFFMKVPEYKFEMLNENCHRCHEEVIESAVEDIDEAKKLITAKTEEPKSIGNVHPLHVGQDVLCSTCHNRVIHSTKPAVHKPGMDICFRCHNGEDAPKVDCIGCHNGPRNVLVGTGAEGVEGEAGYMADEDCTGCHNEENDLKFSKGLCIACHDDDDEYLVTKNEWQESYKTRLDKTTALYNELKKLADIAESEGTLSAETGEQFRTAEYNYHFITQDKSKGVHNTDFAEAIFDDIDAKLNKVKEALQ